MRVPVTYAEASTYFPTGDSKDAASFALIGSVYRDALRLAMLSLFQQAHATAVSLRVPDVIAAYPGYTVQADFSGLSFLNTEDVSGITGIPGAGRGGGYGFPDITATISDTNMSIWEVKYASDPGITAGAKQLNRYLSGARAAGGYSTIEPGDPFPECQSTSMDAVGGGGSLELTVCSSDVVPGLETYSIDGGTEALVQLAQTQLADEGITVQAELQGQLTEVVSGDTASIDLDGSPTGLSGTFSESPFYGSSYVYLLGL
jgi:hypothetical protein